MPFLKTGKRPLTWTGFEKIVLYHWNRSYPGDFFFDIDVTKAWHCVFTRSFAGSSHDKITEEVYEK